MERPKRRRNDIIENSHEYKKQKLHDDKNHIKPSRFEDLANETIYEIFDYLDYHHVYDGFFNLNQRFKHLLKYSNLPIQINISTMTKTNFERYYKKVVLPNRHRINSLRVSNPFTADLIFSPAHMTLQFNQLEILVLDHINCKSFAKISTELSFLRQLHSLMIDFEEDIECPSIAFGHIFRMSTLKYCRITYRTKDRYRLWPIYFTSYTGSSIEHLVINTRFPFQSLHDLLSCLPQLRRLSINYLANSNSMSMDEDERPFVLKHLTFVSFKLDAICFDRLEDLIKKVFRHVQVLRLTTKYGQEYLDAKRWEHLLSSSMPDLRIFDIKHHGYVSNDQVTFHDLVNQFNSSFWIEKQWFFTHQHDWQKNLNHGIFYSTDPYRRRDYTVHWDFDQQICSHVHENFNSVKHVHIDTKHPITNCVNYFPNATELTIKHYFKTPDHSIARILNDILPLKKLTTLVIKCSDFPFEQIVKLIRWTSNLQTLKFSLTSFDQINSKLIEQSPTFQYVSNTNQIKYLDIRVHCTLERIQLLVSLFPKLEYLKIGMEKEEIHQIVRFLLAKHSIQTRHLFFLCISEIPKRFLKELKMLIKAEHLLDDYYMKFVNRDLYLWW